MKKLLLFAVFTLLTACNSIEYDGETRLLITGKVVDMSESPMPNRSIRILVNEADSYHQDIISNGTTDESGNFKVVIPAPKNLKNYITVEINKFGDPYELKTYDSIKRSDFANYKLDLGLIILNPGNQW